MSEFKLDYQKKNLPARNTVIGAVVLILGLILAGTAFAFDPQRASFNTIITMMFILGVGFGSLFLVALEYVVGALWSVPLRRVTEILSTMLFVAPLLAIPLFMNMHDVFEWTHTHVVEHDPFLKAKAPYLDETFFMIRTIAVFAIMWLFYMLIVGKSQKQDKTKNPKTSKTLARISAAFMPIFAISITVMAIDWLMTLEPHWFSTIFGVYYFAGSLLSALALTTFAVVTLNEAGYMSKYIRRDHYYNLGALMFAFTNFWAYIGFSQLLLIWYANVPEETFWFLDRWQGSWMYLSVGLIFVKFVVPYALLLSQPSKSNPKRLKFAAVWILVAQIYDLYWLVMPTYSKHHEHMDTAYFGWMEISIPLVIIGLLILVFNLVAKRKNLIPVGDPKIKSGLEFHL